MERDNDGFRMPVTDFHESEKEYGLSVELPGIDKNDISIEHEGNRLSIRGSKKVTNEKGKKGDKAAKEGKEEGGAAEGGAAAAPKRAPAPKLSRTGNDDEATVQKFSSQRMRARLEARQRRLAEEGRELSLGSAPTLPAPPGPQRRRRRSARRRIGLSLTH